MIFALITEVNYVQAVGSRLTDLKDRKKTGNQKGKEWLTNIIMVRSKVPNRETVKIGYFDIVHLFPFD